MPFTDYIRPKTLADVMRRHHLIDLCRTLLRFAGARMKDAQLQEVASSMTLTTLLSLVPLLAVSLAVFAAFPTFESTRQSLEDAIFNSFLPPQYSETILEYLRSFTSHASGLGVFGIAGLSLTGLLLIDKFFVTVNRIFKVRELRPWPQRALIYWAMLTLGPVVIALSMTISTKALRMAAGVVETDPGSMPMWVLTLIQIAVQSIGYGALFKFVPNCRVPTSHALTGGLVVALAGLVVRECFEIYVTKGTLSSIYGAFVAFPVFLLWLYVTWFLVFSGAAITATIPLLTSGRFADSYRLGNEFLTGVALLRLLVAARASRPCPPMCSQAKWTLTRSSWSGFSRIFQLRATAAKYGRAAGGRFLPGRSFAIRRKKACATPSARCLSTRKTRLSFRGGLVSGAKRACSLTGTAAS